MPRMQGAFSTVLMTKDRVIAFRDPAGLRPLVIGCVSALDRRPDARATAWRASRARWTSSAPSTCATCGPARWSRSASTGSSPSRSSRARARPSASSSTSTSRGRTRGWAAHAAGRARADGRDPRPRGAGRGRPRDPRAGLRQPGGARLSRAPAGCPRTTASSRTATSSGPSSSPARSCASTACG